MARKKQEEAPKGSPAWMATFSDLMNLLLCFFVLLFSMSSVDAAKFEQVVASLQSQFNVLPAGGSSIGEGELVSSGISQLEELDSYYQVGNSKQGENGDLSTETETETETETDVEEAYRQQSLKESEEMAEQIQKGLESAGIQNQVELDFTSEYVLLTLDGALLFDSGKAEVREGMLPLIEKIAKIIELYTKNIIEIEGHTDNVRMSSEKYPDNDVLSMYRALNVKNYILSVADLNRANIKFSGRGDNVPIADNSTVEGRARNRRVEIKIYNSYNSASAE